MTLYSIRSVAISFALAVALAMGMQMAAINNAAAAEDVVEKTVNGPFDRVVTNLRQQISAHQLVVVFEVPHQQMLAMVGVKSEPRIAFEVFHPRYGKVVYENDRNAFRDVPLRIVIAEDGKNVTIQYRKPSAVLRGYSGLGNLGKELDQVFAEIVERVAQ